MVFYACGKLIAVNSETETSKYDLKGNGLLIEMFSVHDLCLQLHPWVGFVMWLLMWPLDCCQIARAASVRPPSSEAGRGSQALCKVGQSAAVYFWHLKNKVNFSYQYFWVCIVCSVLRGKNPFIYFPGVRRDPPLKNSRLRKGRPNLVSPAWLKAWSPRWAEFFQRALPLAGRLGLGETAKI